MTVILGTQMFNQRMRKLLNTHKQELLRVSPSIQHYHRSLDYPVQNITETHLSEDKQVV